MKVKGRRPEKKPIESHKGILEREVTYPFAKDGGSKRPKKRAEAPEPLVILDADPRNRPYGRRERRILIV